MISGIIGQLAMYILSDRVSGIFAMVPDENKVRMIEGILISSIYIIYNT